MRLELDLERDGPSEHERAEGRGGGGHGLRVKQRLVSSRRCGLESSRELELS